MFPFPCVSQCGASEPAPLLYTLPLGESQALVVYIDFIRPSPGLVAPQNVDQKRFWFSNIDNQCICE